MCYSVIVFCSFFFFNDTATTEIYTLSLHDALPICGGQLAQYGHQAECRQPGGRCHPGSQQLCRLHRCSGPSRDRKSTRLNSSHANISYAVFCLKKKKTYRTQKQYSNKKRRT